MIMFDRCAVSDSFLNVTMPSFPFITVVALHVGYYTRLVFLRIKSIACSKQMIRSMYQTAKVT